MTVCRCIEHLSFYNPLCRFSQKLELCVSKKKERNRWGSEDLETVSWEPTYVPTSAPRKSPLNYLSRRGWLSHTSGSWSKGQGYQKQVRVYLEHSFDICSLLYNISVLIYKKSSFTSSLKTDAPGGWGRYVPRLGGLTSPVPSQAERGSGFLTLPVLGSLWLSSDRPLPADGEAPGSLGPGWPGSTRLWFAYHRGLY